MKKDMMWAFLIHLSKHFWQEPGSPPYGMYLDRPWKDNNETDLETWDAVIAGLPQYGINTVLIDVGDAVQYDSHPEISAPDAWSKAFLRQKLDEIRALGMEPIPKLNFSTAHDAWLKDYGRMISTPTYYQVCADLIKEVCEIFDSPRLLHLGLDEEIDYYQKDYDLSIRRIGKLWEHDVLFLCDECQKNGVRPWIWGSFAIKDHREFTANELPKNVLMSAGWYSNLLPKEQRGTPRPQDMLSSDWVDGLTAMGFDMVGLCSTWGFKASTLQVLRYCKDQLNPDQLKGFITAPWLMTEKRELHGLLHGACKLYHERKRVFPETID